MEPAFTTEFDITSVQVGESRSIICAEGDADKYGHVFVTYELDSAGDRTGGTYSGSARAFPGDDNWAKFSAPVMVGMEKSKKPNAVNMATPPRCPFNMDRINRAS